MAQPSLFERSFERLKQLSVDAFKGMDAAEAAFLDHAQTDMRLAAVNFPLEEGLLAETVVLLTDWKSRATKLIHDLDVAVGTEKLFFDRLFDKRAGLPSEGLLRRRVSLRKVPPEAIASKLVSLLSVLGDLDAMMRDAKPTFVRHHRQCEYHLLQIVDRREQVDGEIDKASREIGDLAGRLRRHQAAMVHIRNLAALEAAEQEYADMSAELQSTQSKENILVSERETLVRLIDDVEGFVGALNAQIAAVNVMAAKLVTDLEQAISLLKAAQGQSAKAPVIVPERVASMVSAFEASALSGHGLTERKQAADAAFSRRLDSSLPAADAAEGENGETLPADEDQASQIAE